MQFALTMMIYGNKNRVIYIPSSRMFEIVKKARSEATRNTKLHVPLSKQHRKAVSAGLTGTVRGPRSAADKEAIRKGNLGVVHGKMSEDHKAAISKGNTGKVRTHEMRENYRKAWEIRRAKCA